MHFGSWPRRCWGHGLYFADMWGPLGLPRTIGDPCLDVRDLSLEDMLL